MSISKGLKPISTRLRRVSLETGYGRREEGKEEAVEPLSPGARLFNMPKLNCCIIGLVGCRTKVNLDLIKEGINHTLIKHPRFSSNLVFDDNGKPLGWVRTKVNVDDHIIVPDLDPNMDSSPDEFAKDYVSKLTTTPMDFSKPLWEFHVLHINTSDASTVGVFRFHHSMGDGISLISLVLACTRKSSDPNALPSLPVAKKKKKLRNTSCRHLILGCFLGLIFIFKVLWNTLLDLALFAATGLFLKDSNTPVKGAPGTEQAFKRFVYRTVSLDDIKLIKNVMDMTINDVVLGVTQAGLSCYLNRKYGERDNKVKKNNLPKRIRLRASLVVNIRPSTTLEDLADMMAGDSKRRWEWGNSVGFILLPFHINPRDDPLDHIREAKATIDKKKQSLEVLCTYLCAKLFLKTLGLWVTATLTYRLLSNTTLTFSNVVGPMEEISFYGHRMAYLAPSVYGQPQALTIHFQSYMDKMTLVMIVDPSVIPDPDRLCDDIEQSLQLAKNAVIDNKFI